MCGKLKIIFVRRVRHIKKLYKIKKLTYQFKFNSVKWNKNYFLTFYSFFFFFSCVVWLSGLAKLSESDLHVNTSHLRCAKRSLKFLGPFLNRRKFIPVIYIRGQIEYDPISFIFDKKRLSKLESVERPINYIPASITSLKNIFSHTLFFAYLKFITKNENEMETKTKLGIQKIYYMNTQKYSSTFFDDLFSNLYFLMCFRISRIK